MLLALDPGMNSPGVALWFNNALHAAGRVPIPVALSSYPAGERWFLVARLVCKWIREHTRAHTELVDVVFEKPQWYQRTKSKGDPNDLVGVAGVAANVTGMLNPTRIISPEPAVWIGQLPKVCPACKGKAKKKCASCAGSAWKTPRGQRIWAHLTEAERPLVPDQNDAIDAVGIGLWALGRLERHSVFSNGHDGR